MEKSKHGKPVSERQTLRLQRRARFRPELRLQQASRITFQHRLPEQQFAHPPAHDLRVFRGEFDAHAVAPLLRAGNQRGPGAGKGIQHPPLVFGEKLQEFRHHLFREARRMQLGAAILMVAM